MDYATIIITVCYVLSHVVQYLPVSITAKVPDIVMYIINALAAKHGADEAVKTDMSGNAK